MRQYENWRFTKGAIDPPPEYLDYILCTHIYHCTPSVLDEQPAFLTNLHLEFWSKEQAEKSGKKTIRKGKSKSWLGQIRSKLSSGQTTKQPKS